MSAVIASIQLVSDLVAKQGPRVHSVVVQSNSPMMDTVSSKEILKSLMVVSQSVLRGFKELKAPQLASLRLFDALGVNRDELIHSNAIAACFRSVQGNELLSVLLKNFEPDLKIGAGPITVHRERRLGSLPWTRGLPSSIQARRLDILIEHSEVVLAIENKVDSSESSQQTGDYYKALENAYGKRKKVICIFLSPDGRAPDDEHFKPLSYVDFYQMLGQIQGQGQSSADFVGLYMSQIYNVFVEPRQRAFINSISFWKGKNI